MSKVLLTSSLTIIGGVIIYVLGQIIEKFFIKPIFDQKQIIGEIFDSLIFYANIYANPHMDGLKNSYDEASKKFRQQSSLLLVKTNLIPGYNFFANLNITLKRDNILKAHTELVRLSNGVYGVGNTGVQNADCADKIKKLLNIEF